MRTKILVLSMLLLTSVTTAFAQSGTTGPLTWELKDNTLFIGGTGAMPDYDYNTAPPWSNYRENFTGLVIAGGVTGIGNNAFSNCTWLSSVDLPESILRIGASAFSNCWKLASIALPANLTAIEAHTFSSTGLTSVVIPDNAASIGEYAFSSCHALASVRFGRNTTSIGEEAFNYCPLESIENTDNIEYIGKDAFGRMDNDNLSAGKTVYIGKVLCLVGSRSDDSGSDFRAATDDAVNTLTVRDGTVYIMEQAAWGCDYLVSVYLPNTLKGIGDGAFGSCSNLISVRKSNAADTYTDGISIGRTAFYDCEQLATIEIMDHITSADDHAFENTAWYSSLPDGEVYAGKALYTYKGFMPLNTSINFREGTVSISDNAFSGRTGLVAVTLPGSLTDIGASAFSGCTGLTEITIPENVKSIGHSAFTGCLGLTKVYYNAVNCTTESYLFGGIQFVDNIREVVFGNSVETIPARLFTDCIHLPSVTFPGSIKTIGEFAFENCNSLASATLPEHLETIGVYAFAWCALKTVDIPAGVSAIGENAFAGNPLTAINVAPGNTAYCSPEGILFDYAKTQLIQYPGKKRQTVYAIPAGVTAIMERAFGNDYLTTVAIPSSVTAIGGYAFYGTLLKHFIVQWETPLVLSRSNYGDPPLGFNKSHLSASTLTVPRGTKSLYEAALGWNEFGKIVEQEQQVIAGEGKPAGSNGTGVLEVFLEIPSDVPFSGTFKLTLPGEMSIDANATKLAGGLENQTLSVTLENDGAWLFTITPQTLRSAATASYRKIVDIVYRVAESVSDGSYNAVISNLNFNFDDGTSITESEIPVSITVDRSYTAIPAIIGTETKAFISGRQLHIDSPAAETIQVYSINGILLHEQQKPSGKISFPYGKTKNQVLIVKGSSGWVQKVIVVTIQI
jgi:hypothetical protein